MKRFVYNAKYAKLLVSMTGKASQIDELAKRINANAGHLRIVLDQWHKEGIIKKDKPGRDYKITLTEKGKEISLKLLELMDIDNFWEKIKKQKAKDKKQDNNNDPTIQDPTTQGDNTNEPSTT